VATDLVSLPLPDAIRHRLGAEVNAARLVAARRGSWIWKVDLRDGRALAVKAAYDNHETTGVQAGARLLAAREAAALTAMAPLAAGHLHAHGETDDATWIAVRWIDAPALAAQWRTARQADTPKARQDAASSAAMAAAAVAELHTSGWRHADLQADHILCGETSAQLIDFAFAQGPRDEPSTPVVAYRGGLAHLNAPELAAQLLDTPPHIGVTLSAAAEVFSLAAVLVMCWTGRWMYDYDGRAPYTVPMPEILATIANNERRRLCELRPWSWPHMERLLSAALDVEPGNRPSAHDLAADFRHIA
jgi:hypothetical protein